MWEVFRFTNRSLDQVEDYLLVARRDLKGGHRVTLQDLSLVPESNWHVERSADALTDADLEFVGRRLIADISGGTLFTRSLFKPPESKATWGAKVPKGFRAYALCVETVLPVQAKDRVDLVHSEKRSAAQVAEDLLVLGVRPCEGGREVILAARPKDVELVEKARQTGKLTIVIRNPADKKRNRHRKKTNPAKVIIWNEE